MSGLSRSSLAVMCGVVVASLALSSCSGGTSEGEANRKSTAVFVIGSTGTGMNPDLSTNEFDTVVGCIVHEGLTKPGKGGVAEPALAKSWDISPDGLKYTFHLEKSTWQDGKKFTSADVKYTYENVSLKYGPVWDSLKGVFDRVDTPDEQTAVVHLKRAYAPFLLQTRCDQNGAILPEHVYKGTDPLTNKASTASPIGTGAFALKDYTADQKVEFTRNPDYHGPKPAISRLIGQIIQDPTAALNALRAGEVDYMVPLDFNQVKPTRAAKNLKVQEVPAGNAYLGFFNVDSKPLDDPKVRQALYRAVDMDYITDKLFFGTGRAGASAIPTSNFAYSKDVDYSSMYAYDVDRAKRDLDAAGYPVGEDGSRFELEIVVSAVPPTTSQMADLLKSFWDAVGVKVKVTPLPDAAASDRVFTKRDFDVTIQGYTDFSDPAVGVSRAYACNTVGTVYGNPSGYCDPELDRMFATAATTPQLEARKALYADIVKRIATEVPVVPLHEYNTFVGLSAGLNIAIPANSYTPEWAGATKTG